MAHFTASIFILACLLLLPLDVSSYVKVAPLPATAPVPAVSIVPVQEKACPGLCLVRCAKHSRPNHCNRVCNTCCRRCRCVPPGTAGNRELCGPCYVNMTTHRNATKCP